MRIGKIMRHWRKSQKVTLQNAAEEIGVSLPTLSRVERGAVAMEGKTLAKILAWLLGD
jgi:transcriptional regulator with XRE-family HTH domain